MSRPQRTCVTEVTNVFFTDTQIVKNFLLCCIDSLHGVS